MAGQLDEIAEAMSSKEGRADLISNIFKRHDISSDGVIDEDEFYEKTTVKRPDKKEDKSETEANENTDEGKEEL